jgi:hypothetical protein
LKLFQERRERGTKENNGGVELKYDIFDIRTFVDATMYPSTIKKLKKIKA